MKLLVKLLIAAFIANAVWRLGLEYANHYRFADSVQEASLDSGQSDEQLREHVLQLAAQYEVPLADEALTIRTENRHRVITGMYVKPITLLPGYNRSWSFNLSVDGYIITPQRGR